MRKIILCAVLLAQVFFVQAAESLPSAVQAKRARDEKISAISAEVRDIEARYYARRVLAGQVGLQSLVSSSKSWLGLPEENEALVHLVRTYVQSGKVPDITPEELDALDENKRRVRMFLNNGRESPAAAALAQRNRRVTEIQEPVFALEARYWAWRIAKRKDVTLEELKSFSQNWVGERSYNLRLVNAVEENLKTGNTAKLSKKEERRLAASKEKVREVLQTL